MSLPGKLIWDVLDQKNEISLEVLALAESEMENCYLQGLNNMYNFYNSEQSMT